MAESQRSGRMHLLVVEDDAMTRRLLRAWLEPMGYDVNEVASGTGALATPLDSVDAVCLDLGLDDMPGLDVLKHLRAQASDVPVVVVTAESTLDTVVQVIRAGAYDYITKPIEAERLRVVLDRAIEHTSLTRRVRDLARQLSERAPLLIGESSVIRALRGKISRILQSDVAVCVFGESGTGKELVARTVHADGRRANGPFVAVNCATIPENLQESELFGHERGAFTGATQTYRGCFERAEGGTLFLDELGEMSIGTQAKLLRTLQERTIRRVGGSVDIKVNVRMVCATHRNLEEEVKKGKFREDLYFRLMVFPIEVPPLRDRVDDIPQLVAHFMKALRADVGREHDRISPTALEALMAHDWPGNVRELQNVIHRAMLTCETDELDVPDLPPAIQRHVLPALPAAPMTDAGAGASTPAGHLPTLDLRQLEELAVREALAQTDMHMGKAAKLLGVGRSTLYRRLLEMGIIAKGDPGPDA
ncbi:sigma-54 dependent transcriptional regulator [soil metagenome]